jgi:hypothetical protein
MHGSPPTGPTGARPRLFAAPAPPPLAQPGWRSTAAVGAVALVLGLVMLGLQFVRLGPQVTAPFFVGSAWKLDDRLAAQGMRIAVVPGKGYDGQWFLGLADDPLLTKGIARAFDMPRYRAGRPLYAMTGWVLAGGARDLLPYGLLAIGPLALALGAAATGRLLAAYGRSRWWGLAFAAVPGVVVGVTHATAEPLALALAVLGLSFAAGSRPLLAGGAFAGAALTKETYIAFAVIAAGALLLADWRRVAGWRAAALTSLPAAALLAGWWAYVSVMVPPSSGNARALEAVGPPGDGWLHALGGIAAGTWHADAPVGPLGQVLLVGSLLVVLCGIVAGARRPGIAGWAAMALGAYALLLSGYLLDHFLSSMRALAPSMLAALIGLAAVRRPLPHADTVLASASRPEPEPGAEAGSPAGSDGGPDPDVAPARRARPKVGGARERR